MVLMKTISVSKTLVTLILNKHSNIEYFISETLGYIDDERSIQLENKLTINVEEVIPITLSDEICVEIQSNFDKSLSLEQAINIVMLCGYVFGGV
jgi:hypothetical protein